MKLFQKLIKVLKNIGINANKIELSANDILNLLAGNEINLGSKKITIKSDNFSVDENGNAVLSNVNIKSGKIQLKDGTIDDPSFEVTRTNSDERTLIVPGAIYIQRSGGCYINVGSVSENDVLINAMGENSYIRLSTHSKKIETDMELLVMNTITANAYEYNSLSTLKKNIKKLNNNALKIINSGELYSFNYNTEKTGAKKHIGFVIGKEYKTPQEIISNSKKGINSYTMISICWKAIQELSQQVESLQNEIKILKEDKQ